MLDQISSLNMLRTFAIAAQALSFKHAAQVLNISPTAVSHQIKALEDQLRVQLFVRHTRAISLTAAGEKLASTCQHALQQIDLTLEQLQQDRFSLTLSCCNSFAALWLTPRLGELNKRFAQHTLKTFASDSLINFAHDKHIDLAIRYGAEQGDADELALGVEQIGLYRAQRSADDYLARPNLFVTHWQNDQVLKNIPWRTHLTAQSFDVTRFNVVLCEQEYFVLQGIMSGQGVGLLSNVLAQSALDQGWIRQEAGLQPFDGYGYWLRCNPARADIAAVQQLTAWFKQAFSS